jgi:hypothetical protein
MLAIARSLILVLSLNVRADILRSRGASRHHAAPFRTFYTH